MTTLLAGDIGGTKTNLALVTSERGPRDPLTEATFPSAAYPSLDAMVKEFLAKVDANVTRACFGVAGPVMAGRATITNLPWNMDETELARALNMETVVLLNDLVAIANAIPILEDGDLHTINQGEVILGDPIAVIAPGTGLGEAYLVHDGQCYRAYPSEGGHTDFAPNNKFEIGLYSYLYHKFGHVSWERVCSGIGIPNIYEYVKERGVAEEPKWLAEQLHSVDDPTPIIVNTALDPEQDCTLCTQTVEAFVRILGSEAGNMALKVMSTGGVYLGGGIPPRILSMLDKPYFMQAFLNKGRLSDVLKQVPVHVLLNPKAALLGAASYGLDQISLLDRTNKRKLSKNGPFAQF